MRTPKVLAAISVSLTALPGVWLSGCSSAEEKPDPGVAETAREEVKGAQRIPADDFDPAGFERRDLDLNKDGIPDAYQFARVVEGELVVFRKEVDVNFDGKIDLARTFDEKGELLAERLDTDFDGRVDVVNVFEKGIIVRKEYDTNFDSNVDLWRYFEKNVIARKEADLNHDGKVDYWEYYENGQIDRVGIDRDSDGVVDEWETAGGG